MPALIPLDHGSPVIRRAPAGDPVDFQCLVRAAGYRLTVSARTGWPRIRLHDGLVDFKAAPGPGVRFACLARCLLPVADPDRARAILDKLAYAFQDWMARDVVAAEHRRVQRHDDPSRAAVLHRLVKPRFP